MFGNVFHQIRIYFTKMNGDFAQNVSVRKIRHYCGLQPDTIVATLKRTNLANRKRP